MKDATDEAHLQRLFERASVEFRSGRTERAVSLLEELLAVRPDWAAAHVNRGVMLRSIGRLDAALASYDAALALSAASPELHGNRGNLLLQLERWLQAVEAFDAALAAGLNDPGLQNSRGVALLRLGRNVEAVESFAAAAAARPDWPEAHANQGIALRASGAPEAALASYARALALRPGDPAFTHNWLSAMIDLRGPAAALQAVESTLEHRPGEPALLSARGVALQAVGRAQEALESFDAALAAWPAAVAADFTLSQRGLTLLALGRFADGWRDYEHRWRAPGFLKGASIAPRLRERLLVQPTTEALAGRKVLLIAEQGVGDVLMFASMVPDLLAIANEVAIRCEPRLVRLLAAAFPEVREIGPAVAPEEDDLVVAMGSLGAAFRTKREDFPGARYLAPSPQAKAAAAERLGSRKAYRVGLSWRGGAAFTGRSARSIPLPDLAPVLALEGVEFVSLQYGTHGEEIAAANARLPRPIRTLPADALSDFDDLAGLVSEMDEVLSVQTALIHLSGGLGQRCSVLVPRAAEWRYGAQGARMPWYSSVELLRQDESENWGPVIARAAQQVAARRDRWQADRVGSP